jgi:hypothetical protein
VPVLVDVISPYEQAACGDEVIARKRDN